ncbi:MAG: EutP/PduV family microcompartment system protein [Ruminococcaceae bacterium]|nr:EutP/PduV family microcompartment system protein [Oscillospiraceae bacterium]
MKKLILIGRSESGKTTLMQALRGEDIHYEKTQYVNNSDIWIDTPGEYLQSKHLGGALAVYSYEADVVGLLISATEPFSLISPNVVSMCTRDVIGIITKIDHPDANIALATRWLELAGCKKIFKVNSIHSEGVQEILDYLKDS